VRYPAERGPATPLKPAEVSGDAPRWEGAEDVRRPAHNPATAGQTSSVDEDLLTVTVRLWRADAIVIFDWLSSTDLDSIPITHPAQKQAVSRSLVPHGVDHRH
jgi:hypothetical protein